MNRTAVIILTILAGSLISRSQQFSQFSEGLIGSIKPRGWLKEYLHRQASGLTGHPEAIDYPYNTCLWAGEIERKNESPYAKDWWRYEQTAYYTDGLLRLGYLLDNDTLIHKGERGIEHTIANAAPDGRLGNSKIESLWPMAVFFRAMQAAFEVSGDSVIPYALERNYLSLSPEMLTGGRRHILNLEGMLWTYGKTRNPRLLEMAEEAYNRGGFELDAEAAASDSPIHMHGVTYAEMLKIPMLLYAYTGNSRYLSLALNAQRKLERDHMLPDGVYSSAEFTLGRDIDNAHETCDIIDYTWSLGHFLQVTGNGEWADRIERAISNAAPGAVTKDFKSLQYFSSPNQLIATGTSDNNEFKRGSTWMAYRPVHETECCAGNVNRIMPAFASRLWMRGRNGSFVAALYAPNTTTFTIGHTEVTVDEQTSYPFSDKITFRISTDSPVDFPLSLRIPQWCSSPQLKINGRKTAVTPGSDSFITIDRTFRNGDVITLVLPMETRICEAHGGGFYVERGPLLYSYAIPQIKTEDNTVYNNMCGKHSANPDFRCWNITPAGPYNYAIDPDLIKKPLKVKTSSKATAAAYPFDLTAAPVSISLPVRRIEWEIGPDGLNPNLPEPGKARVLPGTETITLVPYGCTELRLTVFPSVTLPDNSRSGRTSLPESRE
ncbi:MAG: glycoside hydrolase family 127 protein [Muribaculaceae bacterium]|nr:glycoside hydrolase family 127 protein [Muribaculaceae bacterium]